MLLLICCGGVGGSVVVVHIDVIDRTGIINDGVTVIGVVVIVFSSLVLVSLVLLLSTSSHVSLFSLLSLVMLSFSLVCFIGVVVVVWYYLW